MRLLQWSKDRRSTRARYAEEDLEAEVRGKVHDPREERRERRPPGAPEENPFGTSGVGFDGPRSDLD